MWDEFSTWRGTSNFSNHRQAPELDSARAKYFASCITGIRYLATHRHAAPVSLFQLVNTVNYILLVCRRHLIGGAGFKDFA